MLPSEIQEKVFKKGVIGYSQEEVQEFLSLIAKEQADLLTENNRLQLEIEERDKRIENYKAQESAMLNTLEAAKALMGDISASAEKRADILVKNAQLDAALVQRQASEAVSRLKEEEQELNERIQAVKSKFKSFLEAELARFDSLSEELFDMTPLDIPRSNNSTKDNKERYDSFFKDLEKQANTLHSENEDMTKTLTNHRR